MPEFKLEAKKILDELFSFVENEFDNFDVDYEDENLVIQTLDEKKTFIISIHQPISLFHQYSVSICYSTFRCI